MANNSTYKNETDFLEWYKKRYGKEYDGSSFDSIEGMSDDDYDMGRELYQNYLNKQRYETDRDFKIGEANRQADDSLSKLEEYYKRSLETFDEGKKKSQQRASITLDKLKKYLPMQIKAQGLEGLGVSESTMLKAYNNYNSDMGAIERDYQQNKSTLETKYQDDRSNIESKRTGEINEANNDYTQLINGDKSSIPDRYKDVFDKYETIYKKDRENALGVIRDNLHLFEESGDYAGGLEYLKQNEEMFGDNKSEYNAYFTNFSNKVGKQQNELSNRMNNLDTTISTMKNNSQYSAQLSQFAEALSSLEDMKSTMSEEEYNAYYNKLTEGTCVDYSKYYVKNGSIGGNRDDFELTIGSTSRNSSKEYDLMAGDTVNNKEAIGLLNKLTTGTATTPPDTEGTICVVANKMYIYSENQWKIVISDGDDVNTAIKDFLQKPETVRGG